MLVQISEPVKGKSRQIHDLHAGPIGPALVDLKNKALSAFDNSKTVQKTVAELVGPLFDPKAVPSTNNGNTNTGNTNTGNKG